ncbi:hypothetical protein DL771_008309 [Monosporascus sp. 5C6A]|nr:hypothetical protein DL771_008309 [Monosporascus sp. 5C6A]
MAKFSLAQTFDGNLDAVKHRFSAHWTSETEIVFQNAKLNLYSIVINLPLQGDSQPDSQYFMNRQTLLFRGLDSALSLIRHMRYISLSGVVNGQHNDSGRLGFLPRPFFMALFFSAVFLFRMIVNSRTMSQRHKESAIEGMIEAQKMYRQFPQHRYAVMAARWMEDLVSKAHSAIDSNGPVFPTDLIITDCLGASLLWDTLYRGRLMKKADTGFDRGSETRDDALNDIMAGHLATAPDTVPHIPDFDTSYNGLCPWLASAELSANGYSDGSKDQWGDFVGARLEDFGF